MKRRRRSRAHRDAAADMREPRQRTIETPDKIKAVVIDARLRQGADAEWIGSECQIGRSLAREPDRDDLMQAVRTVAAMHRAYLMAISGPPIHPLPVRLPVSPSKDTALERPPADLRTEEERAHAAITAWDTLMQRCRMVDAGLPAFVVSTVIEDRPAPGMARVLRWIAANV